jgi:hypothetical protein
MGEVEEIIKNAEGVFKTPHNQLSMLDFMLLGNNFNQLVELYQRKAEEVEILKKKIN